MLENNCKKKSLRIKTAAACFNQIYISFFRKESVYEVLMPKKRHALFFFHPRALFFSFFVSCLEHIAKTLRSKKQNGGFLNKLPSNFASFLVLVNKATLLFNKFLLK